MLGKLLLAGFVDAIVQRGAGLFQSLGDIGQDFQLGFHPAAEGVFQSRPAALLPDLLGGAVGFQLVSQIGLQQVSVQRGLFPESLQFLGSAGLGGLGLFGQPPQLCVFLGKLGKDLSQVDGGLGGLYRIHDEQHGDHCGQRIHQQGRELMEQLVDGGMDDIDQQIGEKAPGDRTGQADVAVEVKGLLGVIPVADLEKLLHYGAYHIFQRRSGQHTQKIDQPEVVRHRQGGKQNDDGPGAIDRQQRPMEKAPVHPMTLLGGDITGFPDPAAEAIEEEQQGPLPRRVNVHRKSSFHRIGSAVWLRVSPD